MEFKQITLDAIVDLDNDNYNEHCGKVVMIEEGLGVGMKEAAQVPGVLALVLKAGINADDVSPLTTWFVKMMMEASKSPGFLSAEIIPPISNSDPKWVLVEWFRGNEQLTAWQSSANRQSLKDEFVVQYPEADLQEEVSLKVGSRGSVATAIMTHVKPGMEEAYREWEFRVKLAQAKFPGYRGAYYQPPMDKSFDQWTSLIRFDTPDCLDNWFSSEERKTLLAEQAQFIRSSEIQRLESSFPGWFPVSAKSGHGPVRWKTAMLVLLCLYPLAVLQLHYVRPLLVSLPSALVTFICNILNVILMTWLFLPYAIKSFEAWLDPSNSSRSKDLRGTATLIALYAIEILLMNLLVR